MEALRTFLFGVTFVITTGFLTDKGDLLPLSTTDHDNIAALLTIIGEEKSLRHQLEDFVANMKTDLDQLKAKTINETEMEKKIQELEQETLLLKTQNADQQKLIEDLKQNQSQLPIHLEKQIMDLTNKTSNQESLIHILQQNQHKLENDNVQIGFTVTLYGSYISGQKVELHEVISNIGGGYNATNSTFVCPKTGLYLFSLTLMTLTCNGKAIIVQNGLMKGRAYASQNSDGIYESGSVAVIVSLSESDRVWVEADQPIDVHRYSYFSGVKIK